MHTERLRLEWLSLLRGLNILLVVMAHAQLVDLTTGLNHPWITALSVPFSHVRMPLFIFISGGLLYLSRVQRQWAVGRLYADKARRILVPLVFFVVVYYAMKVAAGSVAKTPVDCSLRDFAESFYLFEGHASAPLWFLATLSCLMLLYPLFRWLCDDGRRMAAFWLFSVGIFFMDLTGLWSENYFFLLSLNRYLVFFVTGIAFFRYRFYERTDSGAVFVASLTAYVVLAWQEVPLAASLTGLVMMVSGSQLLARRWPWLFSSFREYIYQVYLMSFIFQAFVELVLWRTLFYDERLVVLFYLLNVLTGIYLPVLVAKAAERLPIEPFRLCLGIKG